MEPVRAEPVEALVTVSLRFEPFDKLKGERGLARNSVRAEVSKPASRASPSIPQGERSHAQSPFGLSLSKPSSRCRCGASPPANGRSHMSSHLG